MKKIVLFFVFVLMSYETFSQSQLITKEDSLSTNQTGISSTLIAGYGEFSYQRDSYLKSSNINLTRAVFFVGHRFSKNISFFSELEMENAKVAGGTSGGEISFEQAFIKFNTSRSSYLVAGLFLPRLGFLNEDHLPINYNGVERTRVETILIPSTWRELGVGYYGRIPRTYLSYSLGLVTGLDGSKFSRSGIMGSSFQGQNALGNNLAITGSLRYYAHNLRLQLAGYSGGTTAMSSRAADSLSLDSGPLGSPLHMGVFDAMYQNKGLSFKFLATYVAIPDAKKIDQAYKPLGGVPEAMWGTYAELGYNVLHGHSDQQLIVFSRYEFLDLNAKFSDSAYKDKALKQSHILFGVNYLPISNVVVKADIRIQNTGAQNSNLIVNPSPVALPYQTNKYFVNLGLGYAF